MRSVLLAIALSCAAANLSVGEKITVDPNVGPPTKPAADRTDGRLAQKITYEARHKRVCIVLDDLRKMTGVTLRAGYNEKDWQVRDRKISVFANKVPLANLMNSIAHAMRFKWSRNSEVDPPTYRLYMDRKVLLGAEAQEVRKRERQNRELAQKRKKALDVYRAAARLEPTELERLKQESPFAYAMVSGGAADLLESLVREVPAAAQVMDSGGEVTLSVSDLTPEGKQVLARGVAGLLAWRKPLGFWSPKRGKDHQPDLESAEIMLNTNAWENQPWTLGNLAVTWDGDGTDMPILDPESDIARAIGGLLAKAETGPLEDGDSAVLGEQFQRAWSRRPKKEDPGEPVAEHPDDPDLLKQIDMRLAEPRFLDDALAALSKASSLAVVSDSFSWTRSYCRADERVQIKTALDRIARHCRLNWEKQHGVIEFRDRDWLANRSKQIPEEWLERWRRLFKKNGTLDLPILAEIARLTPEQLDVNLTRDEVLELACWDVYHHREFLLMYQSLTDDQRAALFSKGLDVGTLTPDQRGGVDELIARCRSTPLNIGDTPVMLTATRAKEGRVFSYTFTVATPDDAEVANWEVRTPQYREPVAR